MRQGLHSGLCGLLLGGLNAACGGGAEVQTDGPSGVYAPTSSEEFSALGIPAPTECFPCEESSGNLSPSIGSGDLAAIGAGLLYGQSVAGWSSSFVGTNSGGSGRWAKSTSLSAGESCVILCYVSFTPPTAANLFVAAGTSDRLVALSSGVLRSSNGGAVRAGAIDHSDLAVVRPLMWSRNASDNISAVYSDLEEIFATHNESAVSGEFSLLSSTTPNLRCCRIYRWVGSDADALISSGLSDGSLLTSLGWALDYTP